MDDKLLLPGVFSGQSCCFCFLIVCGLDQPVLVGDIVNEEEEVSQDNCRPCSLPDDIDRSSEFDHIIILSSTSSSE